MLYMLYSRHHFFKHFFSRRYVLSLGTFISYLDNHCYSLHIPPISPHGCGSHLDFHRDHLDLHDHHSLHIHLYETRPPHAQPDDCEHHVVVDCGNLDHL